jgi:hypothetical protein
MLSQEWHLHTIPDDDWYQRAKKATDRCDLELSYQTRGADKGLEDKVVWVSGLWDLNRGDKESGGFQRSMQEYYSRFQRVLDNGAMPGETCACLYFTCKRRSP